MLTMNFLMFKLVLEKAKEPQINYQHPLDHRKSMLGTTGVISEPMEKKPCPIRTDEMLNTFHSRDFDKIMPT